MPAEVDTVMFGMKEGEISDIIKSKEGFHIVEVVSTRGGEENTFENTKSKVKNDYQLVQAEDRFFDLADQLATLAFEHFDTLEIASEAIDIPVQESDFFTQEGDDQGITSNKKIISSSFSDDILHKQQNSELIELSDNHLAVIRVVEHKPSTVKPIEAIRDQIISDIRFLEASRQQKELGKKILGQLNADTKYDQIETERDIKWEYAESITRKDVSIRRAIIRTAFRMGRPQENEQLYAGTSLGTGDYVVIVLDKVEDPDSVDEKEIENAKIKIQNLRASSDWNGFTEELENQANIVIFSDNI
jgi:peptidyl-prolyl cis-trans isomerase D